MSRCRDWYEAKATVRITKAVFDFTADMWEVSGYIDLHGPTSTDSIVSKEFTHKWFSFGDDYNQLEKIIEQKCGIDLLGQRRTLAALTKEYANE